MNKFALAPVTLAALAASASATAQSSSVTLYGQVSAAIERRDHQGAGAGGKAWSVGNDEFYISNIGLRGNEDLGDGMKAIFRLESGLNTNNGTTTTSTKFWNRQAFVGLDTGETGTITIGRQYSAGVDRMVRTLDIFNVGGQGLTTVPIALYGINRFSPNNATYVSNDNRADDSVKYRVVLPDLGLDLGSSVGFKDGAGRHFSADIGQTTKSYALGAFYIRYEAPTALSNGYVPKQTTVAFGGNVPVGPVKIYANYLVNKLDSAGAALGRPATEDKVLSLAARWTVAPNMDLSGALYNDKGTNLRDPLSNAVAGRNGNKNTYIADIEYYLSKRSLLNVAYFRTSMTDGYLFDAITATALSGATHIGGIAGMGFSAYSGFQVGVRQAF
ncbi:MAG: porin [Paucibacter sp.]|nr:porin [Roseateles sp.]